MRRSDIHEIKALLWLLSAGVFGLQTNWVLFAKILSTIFAVIGIAEAIASSIEFRKEKAMREG